MRTVAVLLACGKNGPSGDSAEPVRLAGSKTGTGLDMMTAAC